MWQVVKLDSAVGDGLGYFGRYRDYDSSDFTMNTAGAPSSALKNHWQSQLPSGVRAHTYAMVKKPLLQHCRRQAHAYSSDMLRERMLHATYASHLAKWCAYVCVCAACLDHQQLHTAYASTCLSCAVNNRVRRACPGYPFDKGNQMWFSACDHQHMSPSEGAVFPYTCDTQPGNSGGPVWCGSVH